MAEIDTTGQNQESLGSSERERTELPNAKDILDRFDREIFPDIAARVPKTLGTPRLHGNELNDAYASLKRARLEALVGLPALRAKAEALKTSGTSQEDISDEISVHSYGGDGVIIFGAPRGSSVESEIRYEIGTPEARYAEMVEVTYKDRDSETRTDRRFTLLLNKGGYGFKSELTGGKDTQSIHTEGNFKDDTSGTLTGASIKVQPFDGTGV